MNRISRYKKIILSVDIGNSKKSLSKKHELKTNSQQNNRVHTKYQSKTKTGIKYLNFC
jgi:hypothetical protein